MMPNKNLEYMKEDFKLYFTMKRIRRVEEKIADLYHEGEMRTPVHLCIGQEAISTGINLNLRINDKIVTGHRSHAQYLSKGGDLFELIAEIYGKEKGCALGRGGSQHLVDTKVGFMSSGPILGSNIAIGTGIALANKLIMNDQIVISYFGDAATEQGVLHEALNFASIQSLPIIFVCENNELSTHSRISERQPARDISEIAIPHKIKNLTVDGNNVFHIFNLMKDIVNEVRDKKEPYFLEFKTYRWMEHVGPNYDFDLGYRNEKEFQKWKERDPLILELQRLQTLHTNFEETIKEIDLDIDLEVDEIFNQAKSAKFPNERETIELIYPSRIIKHA